MTPGEILAAARAKGLRIAAAESCTGGMVSVALTEVAGSSDVFDRGFVTYSNTAKIEMLGVSAASLDQFGAVSEPVAAEMAQGAIARSQADMAVAITGIAGPGGTFSKPEGMVCFGLARRGSAAVTQTMQFGALGRAAVRRASCDHAMELLAAALR